MRRQTLGWGGLVIVAGLCWTSSARADIAPDPERPTYWDEHPAPTPDVPLEDALARRLVPWMAFAIAGLSAAALARRENAAARAKARR